MRQRGRRRAVRWTIAFAAASLAVLIATFVSRHRILTQTIVLGDLYGIRFDRGSFQLLHGFKFIERDVASSGAPAGKRFVGWNEPDPADGLFQLTDTRNGAYHGRAELPEWPPFQYAAVLSVGSTATVTADEPGKIGHVSLFMEIRYRAMSGWLLAALLAAPLPPLIVLITRRRWQPGTCTACGYDLRASPERCPECGLEPT